MSVPAAVPLLAGALTDFALADVLQLIELGARSGVLAVDGGPLGGGRILIRAGHVVDVREVGLRAGTASDVAAGVASLLELSAGRWAFHAVEPAPAEHAPHAATLGAALGATPGAGVRIGAVLVDAARRRDERERSAIPGAPVAEDVPRPADDGAPGAADGAGDCLTAADLRVLSTIDGARDLRAIAGALRWDLARVGGIVARLRARGLLAPADASCLTRTA